MEAPPRGAYNKSQEVIVISSLGNMDAMFSGISSGSGGGAHMSRAQAQLLGIQSDYSTGSRPQSRGPGPAGPSSRSTGGGFTGDPRLDLESLPVERLEALMTDEAALKQFLTTWLSSTAVSTCPLTAFCYIVWLSTRRRCVCTTLGTRMLT